MAFDKRKALQSALTFAQQGKWEKAIAEYQAILKADPGDLTVCNNLGDLYARAGRVAEAIEQYLKLGQLYRADGLSVKAIAVYKKIVKLDPTRTEAHLACADLYEEQGLSGEAKLQLATAAEQYARAGNIPKVIEVYQRLARLDPMNIGLLTKLADLMLKEGMREAAAAEYEQAAQAAQAAGQVAESNRLLKKAHDLVPESPQANLLLGGQHLRDGRYAEALEALSKVTAGDATNARAWRLMGEAHVGLGQAQEAIAALDRAVALGLDEAEVLYPLVTALPQAGRADEAIAVCQRFSADALRRGEPDEAIAVCRALLGAAPNLAPVHAHLIALLQDHGQDEEARSAAFALAAAHETGGEIEAAIHVYRQLLERDPKDLEARKRLEVLDRPSPPPVKPEPEVLAAAAEPFAEEEPRLVWEAVPAEESPAFELPPANPLTPGDATRLETKGEFELEAHPTRVYELDDTGELAGIRYSSQAPHGGSFDRLAGTEAQRIEFPSEGPSGDFSAIEVAEEEGDASGEVAEQLAEAEVYLKYGLTEKAQERLLEVVRLAPDNVAARQRLTALYVEGARLEDACREVLAVARILEARGQREAARLEVQEGLALAPDHPELREFLDRLSGKEGRPAAEDTGAATFADLALPEAPMFEIPGSIEVPEGFSLEGDLDAGLRVGPGVEGEAGADEAAPPGLLPLVMPSAEVAPPDVALPAMEPFAAQSSEGAAAELAPLEAVPALELPLEMEGPESGLRELSPDVSPVADLVSIEAEELPADLRALLEQPEDELPLSVEPGEVDLDQAMAEDLAEAEFYHSQGMVEEARAVQYRMETRGPLHPAVAQLGERLGSPAGVEGPGTAEGSASRASALAETQVLPAAQSTAMPAPATDIDMPRGAVPEVGAAELSPGSVTEIPAASPPEAADIPPSTDGEAPLEATIPKFTVLDSGNESGTGAFVDLGAELEVELAAEDRAASGSTSAPLIEDLLREFQKGVREHLDERDFETHYNLGIAYKEMDLYDEAIQEFRLAAHDPQRALTCANLLGLCYLAKGEAGAAIRELRAGFGISGHPREAYHGLRYDMGVAYEAQGELGLALESFETLQEENPRFRDVRVRVKQLRERLQQQPAASAPASPAQVAEPPSRAKTTRPKISFI
ncbi:MAG: tetratricopeptide repeat protein [candidate division NC10 bacterium]|nr:tetratricopeptide repeat protein [candidate division NC10 bacterium]